MLYCEKCKKFIKSLGWANHCAGHRRREEKAAQAALLKEQQKKEVPNQDITTQKPKP